MNVILEDAINENLLFVGTDNNLYMSLDKGDSWETFSHGMPYVAVHDLVIQNKANDLIVGTHGRSIYKVNVAKLQDLRPVITAKSLHLYPIDKKTKSDRWGEKRNAWGTVIEPKVQIWFYSNSDKEVMLTIQNDKKATVFNKKVMAKKGLNSIDFDYNIAKNDSENWNKKDKKISIKEAKNGLYYLPVGKYLLLVQSQESKDSVDLEIVENKK